MTPAKRSDWTVWETDDVPHVAPNDDLKAHVVNKSCWCCPTEDDGVMVHHSMDQRESYERGRKPC